MAASNRNIRVDRRPRTNTTTTLDKSLATKADKAGVLAPPTPEFLAALLEQQRNNRLMQLYQGLQVVPPGTTTHDKILAEVEKVLLPNDPPLTPDPPKKRKATGTKTS